MTPDERAAAIAAEYAALPEVLAVALGGSRAAGNEDAGSDIDLYVYSRGEVPVPPRREIAERRGERVEVDNRWWGPGDEWLEREGGLHVDVMFWRTADVGAHLTASLERHEARMGYTTTLWHTLRTCRVLFDREGWLADLGRRADQPYPDELARAIIALNFPPLRGAHGAYPNQIAQAVRRNDLVSVNHRLTEFLASYLDILFALNRETHPGEKRLLTLAARLPLVPANCTGQVERVLSFTPVTLHEVPEGVEAIVDNLARLLGERGELPASHTADARPASVD
ncbi:nucleotidyltransferase domain-containing protein [Deinococcus sp. YIM 134068]|uniref:nucleotidyltransferase domain-containing protein n=1 Tax=Deinococcus lichenicola TaxID=3118910 RepID=UPI002F943D24